MSGTIQLKERCRACDGTGIYRGPGFYRRCWTCQGKGWIKSEMRKPVGVPKDDAIREVTSR